MAKAKVINEKQRAQREEEELMEFVAEQKKKRSQMIKSVIAIIVCVGLVIAFCLPSISMLLQ